MANLVAMLGHPGAILEQLRDKMWPESGKMRQDSGQERQDEARWRKWAARERNWEPQGGSNPRPGTRLMGGVPLRSLQTGDSRLRLQLELETPTPAGSPDSDCKRNWMNWMIGDSDWSLRREFEHATVPTARWRII